MKNFLCTAAAVFVCLGVLSGCGGGNVPDVSESSVTFAETSSVTSETAEAASQTEITAETTTVPETETDAETEQEEPSYEIVDMSGYTGNFYEWKYDYDIVAYDRESFAGGEDIINAAEQTVNEKFIYTAGGKDYTYGEIAALAEKAEKSEEHGGYIFEADGERLMILSGGYERFYSENGRLEPLFTEGVYGDFDGDGKNESFLCFGMFNLFGSFSNMRCCVVFVDSEGNAELLPEAAGEAFDTGKMLCPIRYNGFVHMCTAFGVNNSTHHAEFYAVENGGAVHKHSEFFPGTEHGVFMKVTAAQEMGVRFIFWNEEIKKYCTLDTEDITYEEAEALFNSEAFLETHLADSCKTAEELQKAAVKVGGKYYRAAPPSEYPFTFEFADGVFTPYENNVNMAMVHVEAAAAGVDIDKAQSEMVRIEE